MLRHHLEIDVTEAADFGEPAHLAVDLLLPSDRPAEIMFICLPGGGMNSRYFDLPTPEGEPEVSFAHAMALRGHAVALVDPLGAGKSTCPTDLYKLHPDKMAAAVGAATDQIRQKLQKGDLHPNSPAAPAIRLIAAAHSLGALIAVVQQAKFCQYDGLVLMGFHIGGIPEHLTEADRALDLEETRANLVEIARRRFPLPWHETPPASGKRRISLATASERIMATPSLMAMLPNIVAKDAASITVPVLLALGDADLYGDLSKTPQAYPSSSDVALIILPETRHNHFLYPSRTSLFDRVARWSESLT